MVFHPDAVEAPPCGEVSLAFHLALLLQVLPVSNVAAIHSECYAPTNHLPNGAHPAHVDISYRTTTPSRRATPPSKRHFFTRKIEHLPPHSTHLMLNFYRHHVPGNPSSVDLYRLQTDVVRLNCAMETWPLPHRRMWAVLLHTRLLPCPMA